MTVVLEYIFPCLFVVIYLLIIEMIILEEVILSSTDWHSVRTSFRFIGEALVYQIWLGHKNVSTLNEILLLT